VIAVYAIGGGAGHVTRARRVIDALGIRDNAFILATPSDPRAAGGIPLVEIARSLEGDVAAHRTWLDGIECERMIVDVFPAGIQGELAGFDRVPLDFVGRILRVDEYRRATNDAAWPQFETAYLVEEAAPEVRAQRVVRLELSTVIPSVCEGPGRADGSERSLDCAEPPARPGPSHTLGMTASYWLIVHSGPADEVEELIAYTRELTSSRVLVATPCDIPMPSGFARIDAFPVSHLFADAERIVSAAGFNVMLETEPWRDKHIVLPFPRRFDDQFLRAARRRDAASR
jgi:hypothetical protein